MEEEKNICSICLDLLIDNNDNNDNDNNDNDNNDNDNDNNDNDNNDNNDIIITDCNHCFHNNCINDLCEYYMKKNIICKCPLCKSLLNINIDIKYISIEIFIKELNNKINEYDQNILNQNPEIILDNVMYSFNGMHKSIFPKDIFFNLLVFDRIDKYSFYSYNYWFSKKSYKYQLVKILNNENAWILKNSYKKYYDISLDVNDNVIIDII